MPPYYMPGNFSYNTSMPPYYMPGNFSYSTSPPFPYNTSMPAYYMPGNGSYGAYPPFPYNTTKTGNFSSLPGNVSYLYPTTRKLQAVTVSVAIASSCVTKASLRCAISGANGNCNPSLCKYK